MGSAKPALDWHGSTLLRRVTGILARSLTGPIVVVSAPGQTLPALPTAIEVVTDARPGRGPLQGLAAGLAAMGDRARVAYVSSVDVPLLQPAFVRAVVASALDGDVDVAMPEVGGHRHPLAAAYRVSVRGLVDELLSGDQLALGALLDRCTVRVLSGPELPAPYSVTNLNAPDDYERALALRAPGIDVNESVVPAWTLGDVIPSGVAAMLNGAPVDSDPELPLVAGDSVTF
jgi:molybdopterin-guanine dinucleotide biosynthesis protein A